MSPLPAAVARAFAPVSKNRYVERPRLVHPHNPPRARPAFLLYAPRAARAADARAAAAGRVGLRPVRPDDRDERTRSRRSGMLRPALSPQVRRRPVQGRLPAGRRRRRRRRRRARVGRAASLARSYGGSRAATRAAATRTWPRPRRSRPLPQEAVAEGRFAGMFSRCEAVVACEADESDALGGAHGLHGAEPPRAGRFLRARRGRRRRLRGRRRAEAAGAAAGPAAAVSAGGGGAAREKGGASGGGGTRRACLSACCFRVCVLRGCARGFVAC